MEDQPFNPDNFTYINNDGVTVVPSDTDQKIDALAQLVVALAAPITENATAAQKVNIQAAIQKLES